MEFKQQKTAIFDEIKNPTNLTPLTMMVSEQETTTKRRTYLVNINV